MIRKISDRAKPGSISLGLGEPDLPTPDVIVREAVRVIREEKSGYTLQAGLPSLRERIAGDYPHMNLSTDQVIVTAGSQESLYLILRTLVESGDEVLMPDPRERLIEIHAHDGMADWLAGRRRGRNESSACSARIRGHVCIKHFAEGGARSVDR